MAAVRLVSLVVILSISLYAIPSLSLSDEEALLQFRKSLNITKGDLNSWRPGTSPCNGKWWGITCQNGKLITGIHITQLGLSGTVDVEALSSLQDLRTVQLDNNMLSGTMPPFDRITHLKSLLLSNNSFSGEIPGEFFRPMTALKRLFLDNNGFTGQIPPSLMQLPNIEELDLHGNQFSGEIPNTFKKSTLKKLDLGHNNLEGEIPRELGIFNATSFQGNLRLCGYSVGIECPDEIPPEESAQKSVLAGIVLIILFFIIICIIAARRRRQDQFQVLDKDQSRTTEVVQVPVPDSPSKQQPTESIRSGKYDGDQNPTRKEPPPLQPQNHGRGGSGGVTDLIMVNEEKGVFGLPDLMKAAAEVLGNGSVGSAYKAVMANGLAVVVKRIRDMNKLGKDAFDVEIRRLGRLRHPNVLTPLAYHYRREEKLIVSEYMPGGSLLYVLHGDGGIHHSNLTWPTRLKIIQGIAKGIDFLHNELEIFQLPHGNLKSSNVLLNHNYEPAISDYAFQPLLLPDNAAQTLFAYKTPEFTKSQQISPKSDVYCLGIVILEIITGKFPSQYLGNGSAGTDVVAWVNSAVEDQNEEELIDPKIGDADLIGEMVEMIQIGADCVASNPDLRLDMREAVRRIEQVQIG